MKFKNKFNIELKINANVLTQIKHKTVENLNNLDLENLLKEIKLNVNLGFEVNSTDINYSININNKDIDRKEKIIDISTKLTRENLKNKKIKNYFINVTYKIFPKKFKNYKLLIISRVNILNKNIYNIYNNLSTY